MDFLITFILIMLNGAFALSEMAIVGARKARLRELANSGSKSAQTALNLSENPDRFLSTVQVGITLIGIVSGVVGGRALAEPVARALSQSSTLAPYSLELALALVVGGVTYLTLVLGELVPKRLALRSSEKLACLVARPMTLVAKLAAPVVKLLSLSTSLVLKLFPGPTEPPLPITEEELKILVAEGTRAGVFRTTEQDLLHRVLELEELPVSRLMRPRREIAWLNLRADSLENLKRIKNVPHSRFPVCDGDLDKVVGVALVRNLLVKTLTSSQPGLSGLTDDLLPPLLLPQHLSALVVLERFRHSKVHLGLLVDEHGTIQGLVTVNDIMEAIVGDLTHEGGSQEPLILQREDGSYLLDGLLPIEKFFHLVGQEKEPSSSGYTTLAGFVIEQMGRIPKTGDHFLALGHRFEVVDMDGHRIDKILMSGLESR